MSANVFLFFFFFNDTATTEIYTLSLHDALPISARQTRTVALGRDGLRTERHRDDEARDERERGPGRTKRGSRAHLSPPDRKSTRLNSSHANISYAVFCLKKKRIITI